MMAVWWGRKRGLRFRNQELLYIIDILYSIEIHDTSHSVFKFCHTTREKKKDIEKNRSTTTTTVAAAITATISVAQTKRRQQHFQNVHHDKFIERSECIKYMEIDRRLTP